MRRDKGKQSEVSLYDDDLSNKLIASDGITSASSIDFDFNDERLAKAFNKLSANRKRILIMLYVDRIPPEEIAKEYSYSLRYVYNIKMRAIADLRKQISEDN